MRLSLLWTSEGEKDPHQCTYIIYVCVVHAKLNNVVFCMSEGTDQESISVYVGSVCDLTQSKFIVAARNKNC